MPPSRAAVRFANFVAAKTTAPSRSVLPTPRGAAPLAITTEDGVRLAAFVFATEAPRATAILAHGYRDDRRQLVPLVADLLALGYRVIAFDFRGHGESEGSRITIGLDETKDVRAVIARARAFGDPVLYVGFSMGAAAYLLSGVEADAALVDAPYDTLEEAVRVRLQKLFVPRAWHDEVLAAGERAFGVKVSSVRPIDAVSGLKSPTTLLFAKHDLWIGKEVRERFDRARPVGMSFAVAPGSHSAHVGATATHALVMARKLLASPSRK